MAGIITLTPNPALDVSTKVEKLIPEEKLRCDEPVREPGGGGINVSRALKKLGSDSNAIFTAGGMVGDMYEKLLKKEGIGCCAYNVQGNMRENIMILDNSDNKLYRFNMPGGALKENEWKELLERIDDFADADYIVASGSLPPGAPDDFYARLSKKATDKAIRLVLDTSGPALRETLKVGAYLIKPNKTELGQLVGRALKSVDEVKKAATEIIEKRNIEVVVVSMGSEGAILATKDGVEKYAAPQVEKKSSVGAGDSMVAGIVCKLAAGKDIQEAMRYGLACGSAAIMTPGSELLRKEDADRLFEGMGRG